MFLSTFAVLFLVAFPQAGISNPTSKQKKQRGVWTEAAPPLLKTTSRRRRNGGDGVDKATPFMTRRKRK